jgi:voltage-gated potassium channel
MTTVGYGDESPKTVTGKFVAATVMVVGIGFIAIVTGAIAHTFITRTGGFETKTENRLDDVVERLVAPMSSDSRYMRDSADGALAA